MEVETILITHSDFQTDSIYLVKDTIQDRGTLRRLRKVSAMWSRGPDDIKQTGEVLYCPGCIIVRNEEGFLIAWELRKWNADPRISPEPTDDIDGWRHLLDAGYRVMTMNELAPLVGWTG